VAYLQQKTRSHTALIVSAEAPCAPLQVPTSELLALWQALAKCADFFGMVTIVWLNITNAGRLAVTAR